MLMADLAFEIAGVNFTYPRGKDRALNQISLSAPIGSFTVVSGPSGAGKSTLCRCFNGLIPQFQKGDFQGQVMVLGQDTAQSRVADLSRRVGLVFQDFESQLFSTRAELEVAFGPENFGVPREEIGRRIGEALRLVGLEGFERRVPATLSGGEKQRLAIASVLSGLPELLVMDEPTSDLDPMGKSEIFSLIKRLPRSWLPADEKSRFTMLLVEHEMGEAVGADRLVVLEGGKLVREGSPEQVLADIDFVSAHGIRPLQIPLFFHRLGEREELPLTVEEGERRLRQRGLAVSEQAWDRLATRDAQHQATYGEPIIEVNGLRHCYSGGTEALAGIDLTIRKGEFLAIAGQNGSGKTTLAKHFNGLLRPSQGEVRVKGLPTHTYSVSELSKVVGYVFQNPDHQIFADTVFEEIAFGPRNMGVAEQEIKRRAAEALEAVELTGGEEQDPFALTKGERQRVAVASILATQPEVLVFDEPTTGLDYPQSRKMMELIQKLNERGHTVVVITHSMWVVAEYAHRCLVMKEGRVSMEGSTRSVFSDEEKLAQAKLLPPEIAQLGNRLGRTVLSVQEMASVLG